MESKINGICQFCGGNEEYNCNFEDLLSQYRKVPYTELIFGKEYFLKVPANDRDKGIVGVFQKIENGMIVFKPKGVSYPFILNIDGNIEFPFTRTDRPIRFYDASSKKTLENAEYNLDPSNF